MVPPFEMSVLIHTVADLKCSLRKFLVTSASRGERVIEDAGKNTTDRQEETDKKEEIYKRRKTNNKGSEY